MFFQIFFLIFPTIYYSTQIRKMLLSSNLNEKIEFIEFWIYSWIEYLKMIRELDTIIIAIILIKIKKVSSYGWHFYHFLLISIYFWFFFFFFKSFSNLNSSDYTYVYTIRANRWLWLLEMDWHSASLGRSRRNRLAVDIFHVKRELSRHECR